MQRPEEKETAIGGTNEWQLAEVRTGYIYMTQGTASEADLI